MVRDGGHRRQNPGVLLLVRGLFLGRLQVPYQSDHAHDESRHESRPQENAQNQAYDADGVLVTTGLDQPHTVLTDVPAGLHDSLLDTVHVQPLFLSGRPWHPARLP